MVIINESVFNAFVADGRRIFGAMMKSDHRGAGARTGHLAGGHLSRLREQLAAAQTQMIIAMLLARAAGRGRTRRQPQ